VRDALVELVDFPATVYDLCGIQPPYWHFGKSLLPLVAGSTLVHRDAVFCEGGRLEHEHQADEHESTSSGDTGLGLYSPRIRLQLNHRKPYHTKAAMCRTRTHKYVRRLYEQDELYDLVSDPQELRNVIDDPAYSSAREELRDRMLRWYQETCDVVPLVGDRR
jgi:arylsulfatase A-like enzyme